jgi:hypothetical protein
MIALLPLALLASSTNAQTRPATTTAPIERYLINGRVIDATTTKPIEKFTLVMRPTKNVYWQNHMVRRFTGGTFKFPHPRGWNDILIRVWADGYKPSIVRVPEDKDEIEVWLKPAQTLKGRVIGTDGKPLADAQVGLAGIGQELHVNGTKLSLGDICHELDRKIVTTSADGTFELPDDPEAMKIVVVHALGYGEADVSRIDDPIGIQPWAAVTGQLLRGSAPAPGWQISAFLSAPERVEFPFIHHDNGARTDADGRFSIEHIPPGRSHFQVNFVGAKTSSPVFGLNTSIDFKPGQTINITLGGEGRPVIGRLVPANGSNVKWTGQKLHIGLEMPSMGFIFNSPIEDGMREAQRAFMADGLAQKYYRDVEVAPDGRFHIEHLPQGNYDISGVALNPRADHFEVKPIEGGKTDEPLDLGDLKVGRPEE